MLTSCRLWLGIALMAIFAAGEANAQHNYLFGRNKIQHENFDWHVLKTDHFKIFYYPEMKELAGKGAEFAEEAYEDMQNRFNYSLGRRVPLIFYSSNLHFKQTNVTPGFIPDGVGGFFEFMKGRVVIPANGDLHNFRNVIRHEIVHVFTFMRFLRAMRDHRVRADYSLPLWFTEGLAEHWAEKPGFQHGMVMRDAVYSNYLVPMSDLYRIRGTFQMYKQGESICSYIAEHYGEEKLLELVTSAWKSKNFEEVIESVLPVSFEELERSWERSVRETYYPELEKKQLSSLIARSVSARGFSAKPAFYHFDDGTRKIYFVGNRSGYTNVYEVEVNARYEPISKVRVLVEGERSSRFESFHLLSSRMNVSPQGDLAFVTKSGGHDVIHVYDLEADRMEATLKFDDLIGVYSPTWSPDGRRIAFSSIDKGGFSDLYIYGLESGRLRQLTDDDYDDSAPAWSPDGRFIAFSSDRTSLGKDGSYNLFAYDLNSGAVRYITHGRFHDDSPRWSPSGEQLIFTRVEEAEEGPPSAKNIWVADVKHLSERALALETNASGLSAAMGPATTMHSDRPVHRQLTDLTTAAFDPVWTSDGNLLFSSFEDRSFSVRHLDRLDSLMQHPVRITETPSAPARQAAHWTYASRGVDDGAVRSPYRRTYSLDAARGQVSQNPVWGSMGGAMLAFSDMLGDDHWFVSFYTAPNTRDQNFLERINFSLARVQLHRRTNMAYGIHRYAGRRYDLTDPSVNEALPILYETLYGGFGTISYPLSTFRRLELSTSVNYSHKRIPFGERINRKAVLLSNQLAFVHDNALYGANGPVDGWRANLSAAYTTDVWHSHESYYSLTADVRNYWRFFGAVTFASRFMMRYNDGRRARLALLGGSWSLRGWNLYDVRGKKMWFTSHELRFPIVTAPGYFVPVLAPFGISNIRGAAFIDAAHAWNQKYSERIPAIFAGETLGALGAGLRVNLFGGLVIRYDLGWRYRDGFTERGRFFKQLFFGYNF